MDKLNHRQYPAEMFMTRRGFNNKSGLLNYYSGMLQYIGTPSERQPSENYVQQTYENAEEDAQTLEALDDAQPVEEAPDDAQIDLPEGTPMEGGSFEQLPEESI
jgi:hypothetical protein